MIDTIHALAPMNSKLFKAVMADSPPQYRRIWKRVNTPFGIFKLTIHVKERKMELNVCPMRYLKGHNVFGTNQLDLLLQGVLELIYSHFNLAFTERDEAFYAAQGVELARADLTASFMVGSQAQVFETLDMLRAHLLDHGRHIVVHEGTQGVETVYVGKNSSHSSIKFYNKYADVLAHGKSACLPYYQELLTHTERVVRFEVTLRAPALKYYSLGKSKAWSVGKVREILNEKLQELGLSTQLFAELPSTEVDTLTDASHAKYSLWLAGNDLKQHYAAHTFNRDRKIFLAKGIDIARTHSCARDAVILSEKLSATQMKTTWPNRFVSLGAVYR